MLRLTEVYTSVQGEGPGAGKMTQFIRFGGCNLRCPGWPCDTMFAVDPKFRNEWEKVTVDELMERVASYPRHVVLTGGEPHLQPKGDMQDLFNVLHMRGYDIEIFSNGTLPYPEWICHPTVSTIMDWKLPSSGEDPLNEVRIKNLQMLTGKDAVKFVIGSEDDLGEALRLWGRYIKGKSGVQVYYGAVWGKVEDKWLVEQIGLLELDWKLNVQMHNYIWPRDERGR